MSPKNRSKDLTFSSGPNCQSCGSPFAGKFCHECGEKKLDQKDYTLKKFIIQTIDGFTHFDGKFFLSIKYLLFYPGKLTIEYLAGRRVQLMKPMQLFIILLLLFFVFLKSYDILYHHPTAIILSEKKGEVNQPMHQFYMVVLKAKSAYKGITIRDFIEQLKVSLPVTSKAGAIALIPLLAGVLYILGFKKHRFYTAHLVHATHLMSFFFALCLAWDLLYRLFTLLTGIAIDVKLSLIVSLSVFAIYLFISIKKVLKQQLAVTLLSFFVAISAWLVLILVYRYLITAITLLLA